MYIPPAPPTYQIPVQQTSYASSKFCPNCGIELPANSRFCHNCGKPT
jgi:predicted amidophosphoribosyltransferase